VRRDNESEDTNAGNKTEGKVSRIGTICGAYQTNFEERVKDFRSLLEKRKADLRRIKRIEMCYKVSIGLLVLAILGFSTLMILDAFTRCG